MAVFKGGPALPKRTEMEGGCDSLASGSSAKRQRRPTTLLSNPRESSDVEVALPSATVRDDSEDKDRIRAAKGQHEANKMPMVIDGGETAKPMSELRSTVLDQKNDTRHTETFRPKEEPDMLMPVTPKKSSRGQARVGLKGSPKTPKKEEASTAAVPRTSEQAPLASDWQAEHWDELNFAILKVAHDHAAELYDASPSLAPWRIKGRLLVKLRHLMKDAQGGEVASKRWDVELKPSRNKASPKKQT